MKKILFNSAFILLSFIIVNNLLVILSFITSSKILAFAFPFAFLISILVFLFIDKKSKKTDNVLSVATSILVIVISIGLSIFYFDLSWDGQWYQQSAIYHLKSGWNPFFEPIKEFEINNSSSIAHFPKSSWYYGASIFITLGVFEAGKSINFIILFVGVYLVYYTLRQYNITKLKSIIITLIIALNPVIWSEITTYLVDGLLVLYLTIYIAMLFAYIKEPNLQNLLLVAFAVIALINTKYTGLIFFCVLAFFFTIYLYFYKRAIFIKSIVVHGIITLVALFVFGFNPYITNFIERGHPLYPIMGTEKYPSVYEQTKQDDNELYETPQNMQGKPLVVRLFYANFGRPDNAPYYKNKDAELIWPFTSRVSDWKAYHFHETRVSGFGPFFGGILILSFILFVVILVFDKKNRWITFAFLMSLLCTLIFSKHFWWPRFAPQTWLIPIVPAIIFFTKQNSIKFNVYNWILAIFLLINGSIVLVSHMGWETRSSIKLREQLSEISEKKIPIEVHYGWFKKSMEEKLDYWQIKYITKSYEQIMEKEHKELTSVVEGYPNMVLYREIDMDKTAHNIVYKTFGGQWFIERFNSYQK